MSLDTNVRGISGLQADVDANNNLKTTMPTNPAQAGFVIAAADNTGAAYGLGDDSRVKISMEQILFYSRPEGAAIDARFWNGFTATMTITAANGGYTMNAGASVATSVYAILQSTKQLFLLTEYPLYFQVRARLIPQVNSVIEIGVFNAATTAAPTDGAFIRINASGQLQWVFNNNGSETATNLSGTIVTADYYNIEVRIQENQATIHMETCDGVTVIVNQSVPIPPTIGSPTSLVHLPFTIRVYNTGSAPATAPQIFLNAVNVQQTDLDANRPWGEQMASSGRLSHSAPATPYAQTSNFANSTVPGTASLSNTTASYTTLGGKFLVANPTAAETDNILFAYQVPAGYQLVVNDLQISSILSAIGGTAGTALSLILEWGLAVAGSAASLATTDSFTNGAGGYTWAPRRYALGEQGILVRDSTLLVAPGVPIGPTIAMDLQKPLIVDSGRFLGIILRIPVNTWTGGTSPTTTFRGSVFINGHFE